MWEKGEFRKSLKVIIFNNKRTHSKSATKLVYFFSLYKTERKYFEFKQQKQPLRPTILNRGF